MNENRGMKNMDQTSNNQNESDEIKMSRGSVDANEGSLGSGKKKSRFGIGVLVGIVIGAVIITGVWGAAKVVSAVFFKGNFATESTSRSDMEHKLDRLNALIEKYYLYEDEIDKDALVEGIYSGYAGALGDPYTEYYDEQEAKELFETTNGEFFGIGASMSKQLGTDEITIVNVYEDSPADKAGLKSGDILYKVDEHETAGYELDTVVSWIKGEKGTSVVLHVLRDGKEVEVTAVRDKIEVQTVAYEMKEDQIGYIAVSEFDSVTYHQFETALEDLEKQGMKGLVIDLRNNPGGNFDTVTDMLKLLLPEGVIVSTKDKEGNVEEVTCDGANEFDKPLAVNQYSASASEIFSGAVQDYGIGEIVGMTTYGKGVVQQLMDLGDGTCLKMTIAEYYTPNGRSINGKGVEPDVEVEYEYDENNPEADTQLEKALEVVKDQNK
jgi:carboxyl-terminal processing protease